MTHTPSPPTSAATFGAQLRQYRERAGLTQEALADQAGLARNAISALERGERQRPYPHTVQALADALQLSADERTTLLAARHGRARAAPPTDPSASLSPGAPLPTSLTPLIGRDTDVQVMTQLLARSDVRLVTLLGPGGVGKTRLALHVAFLMMNQFHDGATFVSLAAITDPALVIPTIAAAVGVRDVGGQLLHTVLERTLHAHQRLLILDNMEQVADAALDITALLHACPQLHMLVTSRAPLRVRGEHQFPLAPLAVPPLDRLPRLDEVKHSAAVQLFVARVQAIAPAFALTPANATTVAAICRRLDGLPLALELAAARGKVLPPTTLLARLDRALPLLSGGTRDVPERQQTMRTTIAWSYDLLSSDDQHLFRQLAVFQDGWTLDAAEAVRGTQDEDAAVVDGLGRLVDASLVVAYAVGDEPRYRLLEPIRQYAVEQLEHCGEAAHVHGQHAAYFLALAETAEPLLRGPDQVPWMERLEREHGNLSAAMGWLIAHGDTSTAARLGYALWLFLWIRGHFSEAQRWMDQVLVQLDPAPSLARARVLGVKSVLACGQAHYQQAAPLAEVCLAHYRALDDDAGMAFGASIMGLSAAGLHHYERAVPLLEEAVARCLAVGDKWQAAIMLTIWAPIPLTGGAYLQAAQLAHQGLALAREIGDQIGMYLALYNLALVAQTEGDTSAATGLFREALGLAKIVQDQGNMAACLKGLGSVATAHGEAVHAATLWGAAEALLATREAAAIHAYTLDRVLYEPMVTMARAQLGEPAFTAAWAAGAAMSLDHVTSYALAFNEARPPVARRVLPLRGPAARTGTASAPPRVVVPGSSDALSAREIEVLRLIADGASNTLIADRLIISPHTAKRHVANILGKLNAATRTEAALRARELGLV
jgi:predicted ATPase/DNA-binding CsgD family transcriptional regulator/transcriptional regulator with XRE-family HTH domain